MSAEIPRMEVAQRVFLRNATARAHALFPGPLGELIAREFSWWEDFGYLVAEKSKTLAAAQQLMNLPLQEDRKSA